MPHDGGRPHLLYVAWGFPPCRGSGVYRALATANAFAAGGWDVTVITTDREMWDRYTGSDAALEERIDPRIELDRRTTLVHATLRGDRRLLAGGRDKRRRGALLRLHLRLLWLA